MRLLKNESIKRGLSVVTLYAIFIQQIVPFGWAYTPNSTDYTYSFGKSEKSIEEVENSFGDNISASKVQSSLKVPEKLSSIARTSSGGAGQAETSGYSIGSTASMVDKFTGDFSYSIPLMDVEGYPITLSYNSNVQMMTEASWVGLGWDLSVGAVTREMRGIPDEFNGDQSIDREYHQVNAHTDGLKVGGYISLGKSFDNAPNPGTEAAGAVANGTQAVLGANLGLQLSVLKGYYNSSIIGLGRTLDLSISATANGSFVNDNKGWSVGPEASLGISFDSKNGITTSNSLGLSGGYGRSNEGRQAKGDINFGKSWNSRVGTTSRAWGFGFEGGNYGSSKDRKQRGGSLSFGTSLSVPYGTQSSVPRVPMNANVTGMNNGFNLYTRFALKNDFSLTTGFKLQLYDNDSEVKNNGEVIKQPAYGYFHSAKRAFNDKAGSPVMDFDRGTRFEYSEEMKNLDFSVQTFDVFRATAAGSAGSYRGRRFDYGTYYDATIMSLTDVTNANITAGFEFNPTGNGFVVGASAGESDAADISGAFNVNTSGDKVIEFEGANDPEEFDGPVYFKAIGEPTPEDLNVYNTLEGDTPLQVRTIAQNKSIVSQKLLTGGQSNVDLNSTNLNTLTQDITRSNYFEPILAKDLNAAGDNYEIYDLNNFNFGNNFESKSRVALGREENHISKVNVTTNSGVRYVYGVPAYNISSSEVIFSTDPELRTISADKNIVTYLSIDNSSIYTDNSVENSLGRSKLFDKVTVPDYAHSFLLTEMLSSDYIDVSNDGPSVDDIGTWYKFNHTQVYGQDSYGETTNSPYQWRYPVSGDGNEAIYVPGMQGSTEDDLGSYSYGEKEIWYTHSVESRNMIAEFHLAQREDGYAVMGENGYLDLDKPLYYLDKIVLYNRSERINNPNAKPIQTVVLEYDYSLCKNAPSNKYSYAPNYDYSKSGKLTLKKIRVYAGDSKEMALSTYEFDYSSVVRDFDLANIDGWGNYKQNVVAEQNKFFPYALQDNEATINQNIQAWKLTGIKMPAGGEMLIDYEADRYAYVQDKRAMRHFDIYKMTNLFELMEMMDNSSYDDSKTTLDYNTFYSESSLQALAGTSLKDRINDDKANLNYEAKFGRFDIKRIPNNVILFKLDEIIDASTSQEEASAQVSDQYFNDLEDNDRGIYFKIQTEVNREGEPVIHDYIPVYADISYDQNNVFNSFSDSNGETAFSDDFKAFGAMPPTQNGYEYGYVIIDPANVGEKAKRDDIKIDDTYMAHPFQKAAIEHARVNLPDVTYGASASANPGLMTAIDKNMLGRRDVNRVMIELEYAERLTSDLSVVRLFEPDNIKFGGNARVAKITYKDNWDVMSQEYNSTYFWTYKYGDRGKETGVASFEPAGILDECPLYQWDTYVDYKHDYADERKINPTPLGTSLYPNAIVGYETVQVFFSDDYEKGYSESKFITAKDYPTIEKKTILNKTTRVKKRNPLNNLDLFGFTQGFSVVTNDFHGKILSETTFDDQGTLTKDGNIISKTTYNYYGLDDKQTVIDEKGNVDQEALGLEYDIHAESNYVSDRSIFYDLGVNVKVVFSAPPLVLILPVVNAGGAQRGFYSNTFVKHINKYAIVNSVETNYLGSKNSAKNLAFDRETGAVIVSSLKDEYNDELYSVSTPSHWYYKQHRGVAETIGATFSGTMTLNTLSVTGATADLLSEGDQLEITDQVTTYQVWILEFDTQGDAVLINNDGTSFTSLSGAVTGSLIRTGRENGLMGIMQSIVTKKPVSITTPFQMPDEEIISSSVLTLRDRNNVKCYDLHGTFGVQVEEGQVTNPFIIGAKGKLVPDGGFAWRSERVQATDVQSSNHGTRFDGYYDSFDPMFQLKTSDKKWYRIDEGNHPDYDVNAPFSKWRKQGEISLFDEYGRSIQSTDQIRVQSAVLFGYNKELGIAPVAEAVNAAKQDIAYDGFEDYNFYSNVNLSLAERHFDFEDALSASVQLTQDHRHSGLSSLKISAGNEASVTVSTGSGCGDPSNGIAEGRFYAESCLCIPPFEPRDGKYVVGAWVKAGDGNDTSYENEAFVQVETKTYPVIVQIVQMQPSGPIIDGWQRLEGTFEFDGTIDQVTFKLKNNMLDGFAYFDDFRVHPYLAGMTTTVYDPATLLPMATHDGYNFTTFYNYDENLNQVRVRVETIEGIKTISEIESGGQKSFESQGQ